MKTSKTISFIAIFLLLVLAIAVTRAVVQSDSEQRIENNTNYSGYLPIVLRPWEPFQQMERDVLIALYQSTNGDAWYYNYGWLSPEDHCGWMRVVCDNGRVTKLELTGNNLSGPIPPELGNLSNLQALDLGYNQLVGPIPKELSNLSKLTHLWLAHNQLSCWETREVLQWAQGVSCSYPFDCFDYPTPGETICPKMPEEKVLMPVLFRGYSPEDPVPQGYLETEDLVIDTLAAGITHHWTLDLTPGDAITITVAPGNSADILFSLFDSDGLVHQQNMSPAGEVETVTDLSITKQGDHDLVVRTVQGEPTDYALMFLDQDSYSFVFRGTLQDGDIRTDFLPADVDHFWFFNAHSGNDVSFTITPDGSGDPYIELYNPEGSRILTIDNTGDGETESLENYILLESGLYGIRVAEFDFREMDYQFAISIP